MRTIDHIRSCSLYNGNMGWKQYETKKHRHTKLRTLKCHVSNSLGRLSNVVNTSKKKMPNLKTMWSVVIGSKWHVD